MLDLWVSLLVKYKLTLGHYAKDYKTAGNISTKTTEAGLRQSKLLLERSQEIQKV